MKKPKIEGQWVLLKNGRNNFSIKTVLFNAKHDATKPVRYGATYETAYWGDSPFELRYQVLDPNGIAKWDTKERLKEQHCHLKIKRPFLDFYEDLYAMAQEMHKIQYRLNRPNQSLFSRFTESFGYLEKLELIFRRGI